MLANFEKRAYNGTERVWTGRYRNLHNLPHWHLENELICVEQGQATVSHNHQEYLNAKVFHGEEGSVIQPDAADVEGFEQFMTDYKKGLAIERAAVEQLR